MAAVPKKKRYKDNELCLKYRNLPCIICDYGPCDPSHIKTRGSGGPDKAWNIVPMCRKHHTEWGQIGWQKFLFKYPDFEVALRDLGWETDDNLWHSGLLH